MPARLAVCPGCGHNSSGMELINVGKEFGEYWRVTELVLESAVEVLAISEATSIIMTTAMRYK